MFTLNPRSALFNPLNAKMRVLDVLPPTGSPGDQIVVVVGGDYYSYVWNHISNTWVMIVKNNKLSVTQVNVGTENAPVTWTDFSNRDLWMPKYPQPLAGTIDFTNNNCQFIPNPTTAAKTQVIGCMTGVGVVSKFRIFPDSNFEIEVDANWDAHSGPSDVAGTTCFLASVFGLVRVGYVSTSTFAGSANLSWGGNKNTPDREYCALEDYNFEGDSGNPSERYELGNVAGYSSGATVYMRMKFGTRLTTNTFAFKEGEVQINGGAYLNVTYTPGAFATQLPFLGNMYGYRLWGGIWQNLSSQVFTSRLLQLRVLKGIVTYL